MLTFLVVNALAVRGFEDRGKVVRGDQGIAGCETAQVDSLVISPLKAVVATSRCSRSGTKKAAS